MTPPSSNAAMQHSWHFGKRIDASGEILFTVLVPGHRLDTAQAIPYRRLTALVRVIQTRPELHPLIQRLLRSPLPASNQGGPVTLARHAFTSLGWIWNDQWTAHLSSFDSIDMLSVNPDHWAHTVRAHLRSQQWHTASIRRRYERHRERHRPYRHQQLLAINFLPHSVIAR